MTAQLAILGLPGSGKTTLALALGAVLELPVLHTDEFQSEPWEKAPDLVMARLQPVCIVEGITVARLFRRGFKPDCVIRILGGAENKRRASLQSLIKRGLDEYEGRVVVLPNRPSVLTAMRALGSGE